MRCNAGISPTLLLDQHLIAEYRELFIPFGQLRKLNFQSKTPSPERLKLGKGHIVFWRDKHAYLARRHEALVEEMRVRGFQVNLSFWDKDVIPPRFWNDWEPSYEESLVIRERVVEKIGEKPTFYRYYREPFTAAEFPLYREYLLGAPVSDTNFKIHIHEEVIDAV